MEKLQVIEGVVEMKGLLEGDLAPLLVDVRLEEDFAIEHLPGARNNCVFEVAFLERMEELAPDLNRPVCVYGAGVGSLESQVRRSVRAGLGRRSQASLWFRKPVPRN